VISSKPPMPVGVLGRAVGGETGNFMRREGGKRAGRGRQHRYRT
jgi:hypothetical protein